MPEYVIPSHLLIETVRDETVILDLHSGDYYALNAVASRMLQLYRELGDGDAVVARISDEYAVEPAAARADLDGLLQDLARQGLARAHD